MCWCKIFNWHMWYTNNVDQHYHQHWNSYLNILLSTCNISECGVWTKYETFPFGADCKHNWPSVATGLYIKTIAFDSLPSYRTCNCIEFNYIRIYVMVDEIYFFVYSWWFYYFSVLVFIHNYTNAHNLHCIHTQ